MNEMAVLIGLLVFAYFGSLALAPGTRSVFSAPAGSHWVVLGFVLGPHVLGVAPSNAVSSFGPLALVATAWVALALGVSYGHTGNRRLAPRAFVIGIASTLVSAACVGLTVYAFAIFIVHMPVRDARILAAGIGLAGCETSRHALRWVVERGAARSRLLTLLEEITDTASIVPMLGVAICFAGVPSPLNTLPISFVGWLTVTLLLGLVLGLTSAVLLAGLHGAADAWSVLLGAALLGIGIAWRLNLSPLSVLFVMGICVSLGSRQATELRPLLARTEAAVLLPILLLSGALLRFGSPALWTMLGLALATRTIVRAVLGYGLALGAGAPAERRWSLGLGLSSSGTLSMVIGLTFALRFPGPLGNAVLVVAACSGLLGDMFGPAGLRLALSAPEADPVASGA
jgi:hypothetical protein